MDPHNPCVVGKPHKPTVQWSEDVINADPFFGRSWVRFHVPPWVSNIMARDYLV